MKAIAKVFVAPLLIALVAAAPEATSKSRATARTPEDVVRAFLAALSHADLEALVDTIAEDATVFLPMTDRSAVARLSGKSAIRSGFRPFLDRLRDSGSGPPYMALAPRDLVVQDLGDTAVVTFHLGSLPSQDADGPSSFSRRTFVLRRAAKRWRIAHFHGSNVLVEPPGPAR